MNEQTAAALDDVAALTHRRWPDEGSGAEEIITAQFETRRHVLRGNLLLAYEGPRIISAGWFIYYRSDQELIEEYGAFCSGLELRLGSAIERTPTTSAWRTPGFLVEAYAFPSTARDPKNVLQVHVGLDPADL